MIFNFRRAFRLPLIFVLISILSGSPLFFSRIGLIDAIQYRLDRDTFCPTQSFVSPFVSACPARRLDHNNPLKLISLDYHRLHRSSEKLRFLKYPRFLLIVALPILSWFHSGRFPFLSSRRLLPVTPLLLSFAASSLISLRHSSPLVFLISLLPWLWLIPLLFSGIYSSKSCLKEWAVGATFLLFFQIPFLFVEALKGLPIPFGPASNEMHGIPSRLAGTFTHPNSLGICAVTLMSFSLAYIPSKNPLRYVAYISVLPPLLLSRSGTGLAILFFLLYLRYNRACRPASCLVFFLAVLALPTLLGRSDLWMSLHGRLVSLSTILEQLTPLQLIFGQGISVNSNHILSLLGPNAALNPYPADGMPSFLLQQGGLLALSSFYGLLIWVWQCDCSSRPFLVSVLVSSLTINTVELFPVNLLLALVVSRQLSIMKHL